MEGSPESLGKRTQLWEYLRTVDSGLYRRMRYFAKITECISRYCPGLKRPMCFQLNIRPTGNTL